MISLKPFSAGSQITAISRRYAWSIPIVACLGMAAGVLEGFGIGLLIPLLGTLLGSDQGPQGGVVGLLGRFGGNLPRGQRLLAVAGAMLTFVVVKNVLQSISRILVADVDGRASDDIRRALAARLLRAPYAFHLMHEPSRLVNIVATESWHASDAIRADFSRLESAAVAIVFGVMLALVDWRLTLIMVAGVVLLRSAQAFFVGPLKRMGEKVTASNRDLHDRMMASVFQTRVIRLFMRQDDEQARFDAASDAVRRSMFVINRLSTCIWPTMEVLHTVLFLAILLIAAATGVSLPELAAFLVLVNRLQPHLRAIEAATTSLAAANAQVAEVEWLLSAVPTMTGKAPVTVPFETFRHTIEFRDVHFAYPSRRASPSLVGVGFTITAGRSVALLGPSGSGKSTIVNVLCRLVEPDAGAVVVDGIALSAIDPRDWLATIGIAGQDIDLTDGTIEENIRFGRRGLSAADIETAARQADAHRFVAALPNGYQTRVGSSGHSLSGGQRQRIGIARAIARKPSLLILDEATNSVDGLSETAIFDLLRALPDKPTIIVISHRASTLSLCDDAIVIDGGRVVERGELASTDAYRQMAALG